MLKALADRLAEAYAEKIHEDMRREMWGYEKKSFDKVPAAPLRRAALSAAALMSSARPRRRTC
jgi:hypothetical protein